MAESKAANMGSFPRSLRKLVRKELGSLRAGSRLQAARSAASRTWQSLPGGIRTLLGPVSAATIALGGLFIPGPAWLPALADPAAAIGFLGALWQVIGATSGLAVAVVFFVFQGLHSTRPTAMRDAGVAGPFQLVVYLGVTALLVLGLVLLGIGHGAPGGWAAAWATFIAGLSVASLALVFAVMLRAVDVSRLHQRRLLMISRHAALYVETEAQLRAGLAMLDKLADAVGIRLRILGLPGTMPAAVLAERGGIVADINLRRLHELSTRIAAVGGSQPELSAHIGHEVSAGTPLIGLSINDSEALRIARKVVRIRRVRGYRFNFDVNQIAAELHDEAIQAIRGARLGAYEEIAEAQASLLLAIPESWQQGFGQVYTNELASSVFPLRLGAVDRVARNIYEQVGAALSIEVREIALSAAYQPIHIANRAIRAGADGLVNEMLRSSRQFVTMQGPGDVASLVRSHSWLNFSQLLQFAVGPLVEDDSNTDERRRQAADLVMHGLELTADIAKHSIDTQDSEVFVETDRALGQILEYWLEEHAAEYLPESLEKDIATMIRDARDQIRFTVACWVVHRMLADPSNPKLTAMYEVVRLRYSNPNDVLRPADHSRTIERRELLSDWVMSDLPSGEVHVIDSETPRLRAAALLLLAAMASGKTALEPTAWIASRRQQLTDAIEYLTSREELVPLLGRAGEDLEAAVISTKIAISAAADLEAERLDSALMSAPIPDDVGRKFTTLVEDAWQKDRSILGLLVSTGSSHLQNVGELPTSRLALKPTLESKTWAVQHVHQPIFQQIAQHFGRGLARGENCSLIDNMNPSIDATGKGEETFDISVPTDLADQVNSTIKQMRTEGYRPSLIVHGMNGQVAKSLPVTPIVDASDIDSRAKGIRGQHDGLVVAQTALLSASFVLVLDSRAWGGVKEWSEEVGGGVRVALTVYTEATAAELLKSHPSLLKEMPESDRVRELQRRVLVDVSVTTEILVKDSMAVRVILLRPENNLEKSDF